MSSASREHNEQNDGDDEQIPAAASASASSSAATSTKNDATIAQTLHTIQQLTMVFQFTVEQAYEAVEAVGPDVNLASNYLLDNGAQDKGGAIFPVEDCPHLAKNLFTPLEVGAKDTFLKNYENKCSHGPNSTSSSAASASTKVGRRKGDFVDGDQCPSKENWMCLKCGVVRCSRYVNAHFQEHYEETDHCIGVSLEDLSVWCMKCKAYLHHPTLTPVLQELERRKFNQEK